MAELEGLDGPGPTVRGLALPRLLTELLDSGRWRHPGDDVLSAVFPWFEDPLDSLHNPEEMRRESRFLYEDGSADDPRGSALFRVIRGDDVAIALDCRTDPSDPRVVASDAWTTAHQAGGRIQYVWRQVAPSFSAFADALGVLVWRKTNPNHRTPGHGGISTPVAGLRASRAR